MQDNERKVYVAIDLKSFYASVECRERSLDPLTTNSTKVITEAVSELYEKIINKNLLVRRINITANKLIKESEVKNETLPK